jgi:hypothetical protein
MQKPVMLRRLRLVGFLGMTEMPPPQMGAIDPNPFVSPPGHPSRTPLGTKFLDAP